MWPKGKEISPARSSRMRSRGRLSLERSHHDRKQDGRAFAVKTSSGHSVWLPFRLGACAGMYFTADDHAEAIAAVDEFNQGGDRA